MEYPVAVVGFGDNVVDKYHSEKIMYPGGNAANFAVYARRFGARRSAYMGIFGSDAAGEHVIASLEAEGVELSKCRQLVGENGWSRNAVVNGDRVFMDCNEGGIRGDTRYALDRFDLGYLKEFDLVHSGSYCFTERELPKLKRAGIPVSFDFSDDSPDAYFNQVAPWVTYAFLSCGDMPEEAVCSRLQQIGLLGPEIVCASRGAEGSIVWDGRRFYFQQALPVPVMADTMGAGDSLITAFMVGYLSARKAGTDIEAAIQDSLQTAAGFASKVCGIHGAWGHGVRYED